MEDMVVNLHFTHACNYRCRFCHSQFQKSPLGLKDWEKIVDNVAGGLKVRRFNLAGGEPLASPYVQGLVDAIHDRGYDASIITNGSLLTPDFIARNAGKLSMVGLSVDALTDADNAAIGRVDARGRSLTAARLESLARVVRNAGMKLKVNTVVNRVNKDRDFGGLLRAIAPDRWKVFRMLMLDGVNDAAADLAVTDREFRAFVDRHAAFHPVVEKTEDIVSAYIVINPDGRLIDNSRGSVVLSDSLLDAPFAREFAKIAFNYAAYAKRYAGAGPLAA